MRKRLLLINPVNLPRFGLCLNPSGRFPLLGLGIVAALTPGDWEIEILDENFDHFQFKEADLVGITSFTASITRAYEIAGIYRKKGIPTVIGGIHASIASMLPKEALRYVDTVIGGEAESTWPSFFADFEKRMCKRIYREDPDNRAQISGARHDLFHPNYILDSIQTARGCPMDCNFCSVTAFNGHRYRQRKVDEVLDELEKVSKKMLYFVDDNIYGYGPDASKRAIALFKGIIQRKIKKEWFSQASINFANDEKVLEYASKSGCRMILLGLEAENPLSLKDAGKKMNLRLRDKYEKLFRRINKHGIAVLGSFIFGMDHDTPKILSRRTTYILHSDVDAVQLSLLTPLPGTRLFRQLQQDGRLMYTDFPADWERYDLTEVVFKPAGMEPQELYESWCKAGMVLYNYATLWKKYLKTFSNTKNLAQPMHTQQ
jgi:radical SAM superfamily enzyme YgiQ (UPF0313 family)